MTTIVTIVITLLIVGLVLWAVQKLPIDAQIANVIRVVVIAGAVLWTIGALGFLPSWVRLPR
jgi:NADH:ubiquinone oxidoreductase subunit 6 (subunit J)